MQPVTQMFAEQKRNIHVYGQTHHNNSEKISELFNENPPFILNPLGASIRGR